MTLAKIHEIVLIKTGYDVLAKTRRTAVVDARTIFIAVSLHYTLANNEELAEFLGIKEGAIRNYHKRHYRSIRTVHSYRYNYSEIVKKLESLSLVIN